MRSPLRGEEDTTRVTIQGQPFEHLVYHFVLTYSNWESITICFSESFESFSGGLQNALEKLGGVPRRAFALEVRQSQTPQSEPAKANVLGPPVAESPSSPERKPVRVAIVIPVLCVGGAEQWIASLAHWLDPDRAVVTKVIVLFPNAINPVAVSWLPRWVEVVDSRTIEQDGSFDVVITWDLKTSSNAFPT